MSLNDKKISHSKFGSRNIHREELLHSFRYRTELNLEQSYISAYKQHATPKDVIKKNILIFYFVFCSVSVESFK